MLSDYEKTQVISNRAHQVMEELGYDWDQLYSKCSGFGANITSNKFIFHVKHDVRNRERKIFDELKKVSFECPELENKKCGFDYEIRTPAYGGGPSVYQICRDKLVKFLFGLGKK